MSTHALDETGHINAGENEGILFFNNIFPLKLQWLLRLPFRDDKSLPELMKRVQSSRLAAANPVKVMARSLPDKVKVVTVVERLKEGGTFVKFSHGPEISLEEVETAVQTYLQGRRYRPWFNPLRSIDSHLVRGTPWVEDLFRFPSSRLKVEFQTAESGADATELSQEQLYSLFRPYGKLADIVSQPPDSKILPKYAYLDFAAVKEAIMAKNCMHGFVASRTEGEAKLVHCSRLAMSGREADGAGSRTGSSTIHESSYLS